MPGMRRRRSSPDGNAYSPVAGGVLCPECVHAALDARPIDADALKVLRHLQRLRADRGAAPAAGGATAREVERLLHATVSAVLERELRSRDFFEEVAARQATWPPRAESPRPCPSSAAPAEMPRGGRPRRERPARRAGGRGSRRGAAPLTPRLPAGPGRRPAGRVRPRRVRPPRRDRQQPALAQLGVFLAVFGVSLALLLVQGFAARWATRWRWPAGRGWTPRSGARRRAPAASRARRPRRVRWLAAHPEPATFQSHRLSAQILAGELDGARARPRAPTRPPRRWNGSSGWTTAGSWTSWKAETLGPRAAGSRRRMSSQRSRSGTFAAVSVAHAAGPRGGGAPAATGSRRWRRERARSGGRAAGIVGGRYIGGQLDADDGRRQRDDRRRPLLVGARHRGVGSG